MSSQLQVSGEAKIRDIQGPVVANSGVITALDGAASQYVRGDGTLADFPTSTGGGSSVSYYLNSSVSQGTIGGVAYRQLSKTPISGAGTDITASTNGYIASYITDANDPSLLEVPAGNFNCEFYFSVNSNNHNPYVYAELYKYDGTTFTLLGSNQAIPEYLTNGTTLSAYYFAIPVAVAALAITDRIAIRIYVNVDTRVVTLHTENNHLCQVVTTFSKGLTSLNNLTRQVQFLATGTSGTDFNISSSTATHTFNIPDASLSNRGLVTTGSQTFAGAKVFDNPITANSGIGFLNGVMPNITSNLYSGIGGNSQGISIITRPVSTNYTNNFYFPSASNSYTFPNATGTLALTTDLSAYLPLSGGTMTGQIVLKESSSNTDFTKGLRFPNDPFGGSGDVAGLRLYSSLGENFVLELYTGNDGALDVINFATGVGGTPNNDTVTINGNKIWNVGNLPTPQSAITLTTTGTSGAATFVSNTLNIPQYQAALTNPITGTGTRTTNYLPLFSGTNTITNSSVYEVFSPEENIGVYVANTLKVLNALSVTGNISAVAATLTDTLSGTSATFSSTIRSNATNGFAIGSISGYRRIEYGSSGATSFSLLTNADGFAGLYAGAAIFSSSITATSATLNGNVIINSTAAALSPLQVVATGTIVRLGEQSGTTGKQFLIGIDATSGRSELQSVWQGTGFTSLALQPSGGNVLIGTTGDNGSKFQVSGTATFSSIIGVNGATEAGWSVKSNGNLKIEGSNGTTILQINDTASGGKTWSQISAGAGNVHSVPNGTFYLRNSSDGITALQIASTGAATFSGSVIAESVGFIGVIAAYSSNFISFSHTSRSGAGDYSFISASDGFTLINGKAGAGIDFRINNVNIFKITSTGGVEVRQVNDNFGSCFAMMNTLGNSWSFINGGDNNLYLGFNGGIRGIFAVGTGVYTPLSDINKKKDFEDSTIGLNAILGLKPTLYRMKDDDELVDKQLGFIAQEVKEFIPQAYVESEDFIGLNYNAIVAALVKSVQELKAEIDILKNK